MFGAGRDGGREAVFDGPVPVISHGERWRGYGVLQVKHKSRTGNPEGDASWVIRQIHEELTPWVDGTRETRVPAYYLLATNVRLSAVPGSGGVDRVHAILTDYQRQLGLAGFHVWDGDTVEALLDGCAEVRRRFAAWSNPRGSETAAWHRGVSPKVMGARHWTAYQAAANNIRANRSSESSARRNGVPRLSNRNSSTVRANAAINSCPTSASATRGLRARRRNRRRSSVARPAALSTSGPAHKATPSAVAASTGPAAVKASRSR
ncbi:hypothetical protein AB0C38_10020 [Amycolatopsis sp. NPDC048633]|uniref:hypothetical protein n=1 Tax=Amycolatopsis sp. NPDC048633 TaxID=3157095 RepID=UPI0033F2EAFD